MEKKKTTTSTALAVSWLHLDGASHLEEEKQYRQDKGLVQVQVTAVTIISQQPQTFEPMSKKKTVYDWIKCKDPHVSLQGIYKLQELWFVLSCLHVLAKCFYFWSAVQQLQAQLLFSPSEIEVFANILFAMTTILFKDSISTRAYGDNATFLSIPPDKTLKAPLIYYIQVSQFTQKPYC